MQAKLNSGLTVVAIFAICILTGCSTIEGYPNDKKSKLPPTTDSTFLLSDAEYQSVSDQDKRNELVHKKLRDIDLAYSEFETSMYKENVVADLSTDITLLALAGGTVLTGSTDEKELLATISAFILGSKSSFDKRALFESTMSVLVQKMRADRAHVLNDILVGKSKSLSEYSVDTAAADIARYYYAGTIPSALAGLAKTAVDEELEAKEEQAEIITDQFTADAARACLIEFWKPNGQIDQTNQTEITTWKAGSDYNDIPFGILMNGSSAASARIDAVIYLIEAGEIDECEL